MRPAARLLDMHVCPMFDGPKPHVGGPIVAPGCPNVLIGGMPAARVGDMATCVGPPDFIRSGAWKVLIGGAAVARIGDNTVHGGSIVVGCSHVLVTGSAVVPLINLAAQALSLLAASAFGIPFVKICDE